MSLVLTLVLYLVSTISPSSSSSVDTVLSSSSKNCTQGHKAWATLRFTICQKIQGERWCYKGRENLDTAWSLEEYDPFPPNATCSGHSSSCDYLRFLTGTCGAFYDVCHTEEERSQIMGMWIKQFITNTWSLKKFQDGNHELKNGECRAELSEYFNPEEVDEIIGLVETDIWTRDTGFPYSNLTQDFGVLVNKTGGRIGPDIGYSTLPSHWKYCGYKLTTRLPFGGDKIYEKYANLYRCDGKCNTNNGDDQKWSKLGPLITDYFDGRETDYNYNITENIIGFEEGGAYKCFMDAEFALEDGIADEDNLADKNKAYDELCKPFEHVVYNCSIPIARCLGNIAIREVAMAQFLQKTLFKTMTIRGIVQRVLNDNEYFTNFKLEKCKIFGGEGNSASITVSSSGLIATLLVFSIYILNQ